MKRQPSGCRFFKAHRKQGGNCVNCPYCGKRMETGFLQGNGAFLYYTQSPDGHLLGLAKKDDIPLTGLLERRCDAWRCPDCRKLIVPY